MKLQLALLSLSLALASTASASVIDLTFEIPNNSSYPPIGNYYDGGGGPANNYGITFSSNALDICLNTLSMSCSNTSRGGLGDPNSQTGALFFLTGSEATLDDPAGFTTGFSFNYVSLNQDGTVQVFSGLDGAGNLLATINLTPNAGSCPGYGAGFCPFSPIGVTFSGTAQSIEFGGVENQIVFDDVTFGSSIPGNQGTTPEPSSLLLLFTGAGALATQVRRRLSR